ncbi:MULTISPECIES: glycosyltransferase family 39 protein [unclassified Modestobacter]|uniref:glycosyltransferase family 39 protein n=1 Tax=unclassified Modestobacter TaxID=2643866 RepID=UPI0022AA7171|nr:MULTISPECIES: glycosyltransferase family 39 protein [unclassified Modestobacter]MCZ2823787.1 hypothetical protein [Modestobacter sp. VKM Ac-2981]MCZ2852032.1 hypothetical protein [Modestobacter sp. VKM Ac-2982]
MTTEGRSAPPPQAEPVPSPARWRTGSWSRPGRRRLLVDLLLLAAWTVAFWGRWVLRDFGDLRLSNSGDSESFEYYLVWNLHALLHGENPFSTPHLYAPDGLDLSNAISIPSVSLLVAPVTALFGGTAAYNTAFLLSVFSAGTAVFLLARELFHTRWGALLAGAVTIVSPYFTGHALGHLNLMWVFGLPLLAYLVARTVRGRLRRRWLVLVTGATVAFTIGASTELFVTESVFAVVALVVAGVVATPDLRRRLLLSLPWLAGGGVLGLLLAGPVVIAGLRAGIPETVANPPSAYPTDLTNVVAPTRTTLIGDSFFAGLRASWLGNDAENTGYVPVVLLLLTLVTLVVARTRATVGLVLFAGVAFLCSLGPVLTIAGQQTVPLPWTWATSLPGLDHALPSRFSAFVFMALSVLIAQAWVTRGVPRWAVGATAAVSVVLLLPNLSEWSFPVDVSDPPFVTSGALAERIEDGDNVLVLPAGQWGPGMRWVTELDFRFDLPTGNGGGAELPPALHEPLPVALFVQDLTYDYESKLLPYLEEVDVELVVVDAAHPEWKAVMDRVLPGAAEATGGVWVYEVP